MSWYRFLKALAGFLATLVARVEVQGREHVPRSGPAFLVANHQSVLDPIYIQSRCPRDVHTLTKSSQFGSPLFRWILPRILAIPARRFRVDPQSVRIVLRLLDEGEVVGVYPEGERSWDGALQPLRQGTVRVILKAGVPVVPVGIRGSYDVWPRWSRSIRRRRVRIRFGEPIRFGAHPTREEREAALESATRVLEERLTELSGFPLEREVREGAPAARERSP